MVNEYNSMHVNVCNLVNLNTDSLKLKYTLNNNVPNTQNNKATYDAMSMLKSLSNLQGFGH